MKIENKLFNIKKTDFEVDEPNRYQIRYHLEEKWKWCKQHPKIAIAILASSIFASLKIVLMMRNPPAVDHHTESDNVSISNPEIMKRQEISSISCVQKDFVNFCSSRFCKINSSENEEDPCQIEKAVATSETSALRQRFLTAPSQNSEPSLNLNTKHHFANHWYQRAFVAHAQDGFVNFGSANDSKIDPNKEDHCPVGKANEEDRFYKGASYQNSAAPRKQKSDLAGNRILKKDSSTVKILKIWLLVTWFSKSLYQLLWRYGSTQLPQDPPRKPNPNPLTKTSQTKNPRRFWNVPSPSESSFFSEIFLRPPSINLPNPLLEHRQKVIRTADLQMASRPRVRRPREPIILQIHPEIFASITDFLNHPLGEEPNRALISFLNTLSSSFRRQLIESFRAGFPIIIQNQNAPSRQIIITQPQEQRAIASQENFELLDDPREIGRDLYRRILENPKSIDQNLENVCMLIWAFMDVAEKKGAAFHEGTFTIEDPNQQLWNYLRSLGSLRLSSHLRGVPDQTILGIEIGNECVLPALHQHLLVHQYKNRQGRWSLLIKPEKYGLNSVSATLLHTRDWAVNTGKRIIIKLPQKEGERKERIDSTLVQKFYEFTMEVAKIPSTLSSLPPPTLHDLYTWGVQVMYDYLQRAETFFRQHPEESFSLESDWVDIRPMDYFIGQVQEFMTRIKGFGDHLDQRFGSEVIISRNELLG